MRIDVRGDVQMDMKRLADDTTPAGRDAYARALARRGRAWALVPRVDDGRCGWAHRWPWHEPLCVRPGEPRDLCVSRVTQPFVGQDLRVYVVRRWPALHLDHCDACTRLIAAERLRCAEHTS